MILSTGLLLEWLGLRRNDATLVRAAEPIEIGVAAIVNNGTVTPHMGGQATTGDTGAAVFAAIAE